MNLNQHIQSGFLTTAGIVRWSFFVVVLCFAVGPLSAGVPDSTLYLGTSARALVQGQQTALIDQAIKDFEALSDSGGWPMPGDGPPLAVGMRHEDVRTVRLRFRITGDYTTEIGADPLLFDPALERVLSDFQRDHGLSVNGTIGMLTREALNISVEERIAELRSARKTWAEYEQVDMTARLWVNIPEATVTALADNQIDMQMRAVVGHPSRPTPVLSSAVNRVVVNPTWTIPTSIALQDIIPRQMQEEDYLSRSHIRVFDGWDEAAEELDPTAIDWTEVGNHRFPYRLRQDPGPFNSLGKMKFVFPNDHDVYLHDTPTRALLGLSYRTVSSGCIRVEKPEVLASWLVEDESKDRLQGLLASSDTNPQSVRIREAVPIDLVYLTAWVSPDDGAVQFRRDIYNLDSPGALAAR